MFFWFCFFKQKTAYEMRISDWSSDVCSSDLPTWGVLPTSGIHPLSTTHDHVGIVAGSLQDIWSLYRVMAQTAINPVRGAHLELNAIKPDRLLLLGGAAWSEIDEETEAAFERFIAEAAALEIGRAHV